MKYPAADKALKISETRASEKLCSAEASASTYLRARKPHSESGEFRCRQAVRGPILQGRENSRYLEKGSKILGQKNESTYLLPFLPSVCVPVQVQVAAGIGFSRCTGCSNLILIHINIVNL